MSSLHDEALIRAARLALATKTSDREALSAVIGEIGGRDGDFRPIALALATWTAQRSSAEDLETLLLTVIDRNVGPPPPEVGPPVI